MPELPPLSAKLNGEIAEFLAKMEAVKKAIKGVQDQARKEVLMKIAQRYELGKDVSRTANRDIRAMFRDMVKEAEKAGRDSGNAWAREFSNALEKQNAKSMSQRWYRRLIPYIGAALPMAPGLLAGAAGVAGGFGAAGAGAVAGIGALGLSAQRSLMPVLQASQQLQQMQTTNRVGANATALQQWLTSTTTTKGTAGRAPGSPLQLQAAQLRLQQAQDRLANAGSPYAAMGARASVLTAQATIARLGGGGGRAGVTTQNTLGNLGFLADPNVSWGSLSPAQQRNLTLAAQKTTGMPTAERNQIRALMAERQAYTGLDRPQQAALGQTQRFMGTLRQAQMATEPQVLKLYAEGVKALTPALRALAPLTKAATDALLPLVREVGKGIKSKAFDELVASLSKLAGIGIKGFGQALINMGIAVANILKAFEKTGLAKSMMDLLVKGTERFAKWTGSPNFMKFMEYVKKEAPTVTRLIGEISKLIGQMLKSLAGPLGDIELKGLTGLLGILTKILAIPGVGPFIANMVAIQLMLSRTKIAVVEMALLKGTWNWLKEAEGVQKVTGWLKDLAAAAGGKILGAVKTMGGAMVSGMKTAILWSVTMVVRAATALAAWIASMLGISAATAASTAFIIASTGGVILIIAALVIGIYELVKHWKSVWSTIKMWAKNAWDFIWNGFGKYLLPLLGPAGLIALGAIELVKHWKQVFGDLKNWIWNDFLLKIYGFFVKTLPTWWSQAYEGFFKFFVSPIKTGFTNLKNWIWNDFALKLRDIVTKTIPGWFRDGVKGIGIFWSNIGNTVKGPVNWLIDKAYNNGIRKFWNFVVDHIGLKTLHLDPVPTLAAGGKVTKGTTDTADDVLVRVSKDETVVSAQTSRAHADELAAWGVPGYQQGGKVGQRGPGPITAAQARFGTSVSPTGGSGGLPGGGVLHNIGSGISSAVHKAWDLMAIMSDMVSGNATATANRIFDLFGHGAGGAQAGGLAQMITGIPVKLITGAVKFLISKVQASSFGAAGSGNDIVKYAMTFLGKIPYTWGGTAVPGGADCSGFVQAIYKHFGINAPRTSEAQGAWVKKGAPTPGGLAFYHSTAGGPDPGHVAIVRDLNSVISQGGGMGPTLMGIRGMPLLFTGTPPGGLTGAGGGGGVGTSSQVAAWIRLALSLAGAPAGWLGAMETLVSKESGGNTGAHNPSGASGIAQLMPGTFAQFHIAGHGNIWNPVDNLIAGIRHLISAWGSPNRIPGLLGGGTYMGYAGGTKGAHPGWAWVGERGPELVKFMGGETVLDSVTSMLASFKTGRGYASGTNPTQAQILALRLRSYELELKHASTMAARLRIEAQILSVQKQQYALAHPANRVGPLGFVSPEQSRGITVANAYFSGTITTLSKAATEQRAAIAAIQKYFSGRAATWREQTIDKQTKSLDGLINRLGTLTAQHNTAVAYQNKIASDLSGYGALGNVPLAAGSTASGAVRPVTGAGAVDTSIQGQLHTKLAQLKKFASALSKLRSLGLSPALITQVIDMGPDDGYTYAQALISTGRTGILDINKTEAAIIAQSKTTAHAAAVSVYGSALVDGFAAQQKKLEAQMKHLGAVMGAEVARWLGVPSSKLPHFASGGWAPAGQPVVVGENGPELAVFNQGAQIIPNGRAGRANTQNFYITTQEIDPRRHAAELGWELWRRSSA
jgi:cell wall-associated NlpC family hydrolase/SLT domain-containing protein